MTSTADTTPVTELLAGQHIRFTGGHSIVIQHIRRDGGYTYLYVHGDNTPYALPDSAVVYVLDGVPYDIAPLDEDDAIAAARECGETGMSAAHFSTLLDMSRASKALKIRMLTAFNVAAGRNR